MADYFNYRVYLDVFNIPKELVKNCTSYAGIDRGCSLTKVVIVPKNTVSESDTTFEFHCSSFLNKNFDKALEYIKSEAYLNDDQEIHVTGAGCDMFQEIMEETLGRKSCFIDEFYSQLRGSHFLLKHISDDQLFHPWVHLNNSHLSYKRIPDITAPQKINEITQGQLVSDVGNFPCIFVLLGSGAGILPMYEDLRPAMPAFMGVGGRCFLGMARVLLGTGDYLQITGLASKGNSASDICLNDLFPIATDANGQEPGNPCLYPFGKISDDEEQETSKENAALSLIRGFAMHMATCISDSCRTHHISQVIFGGNMARAEIFRISFLQGLSSLQILDSLNVKFLKTGHTGAIGAMISHPKEVTMTLFGPKKPE